MKIRNRKNRLSRFETLESRKLLTVSGPVDDHYSVTEDSAMIIGQTAGLLANDTGVAQAVLGALPEHGKLILNGNGSLGYQPEANFVGEDSFTYRSVDGEDYATVHLTINPDTTGTDAVNDIYQMLPDTSLDVSAQDGLLTNDAGVKMASLVQKPEFGWLSLKSDGSFSYMPWEGFVGTDTFTYRGLGKPGADIGTVTITVQPDNSAPVANDDAYTTDEDTPVVLNPLANDTDAEGDLLTLQIVQGPSHGTLLPLDDGSLSYAPAADFNGEDSFVYVASDGEFLSNEATVTITVNTVNDAPVGNNDAYATDEDTPLTIEAPGVLANDTDVDGDPLYVSHSDDDDLPQHGTLVLNEDGSFTYTPDENFNGTDSFTYRVSDGVAESANTTVTITVNTVNDAPVGNNDAYVTDEDTPLIVDVPGVLTNDTDVEDETLTATVTTLPNSGTIIFNEDGSFAYEPNPDFNGTDSFQYTAVDSEGATAVATVTITVNPVNDAPNVQDETYTVNEDEALIVEIPGVLANDSDVEGDALTVTLVESPIGGDLIFNNDGSFAYMPSLDFNGEDGFLYEVNDGQVSSMGWATIIVDPVNDDPVAQADLYDVVQDEVLTIDAPGVLDNDYDVDGDALTVSFLTMPDHGILFLGDNGSFSYIPASGYVGQDFFIYRADDGNGGFADAAVTLNVLEQPALLMSFGPLSSSGQANVAAGKVFSGLDYNSLQALDSWFAQLGKKKAMAGGSGIHSDLDADDIDNLLLWFDAA